MFLQIVQHFSEVQLVTFATRSVVFGSYERVRKNNDHIGMDDLMRTEGGIEELGQDPENRINQIVVVTRFKH